MNIRTPSKTLPELIDDARDNVKEIKKDLKSLKKSLKVKVPKKYDRDVKMIRELATTNRIKEQQLIKTLALRLDIPLDSDQYYAFVDFIYKN